MGPEPDNQVGFPLFHRTCLRSICVLKPMAPKTFTSQPSPPICLFLTSACYSKCGLRTSSTGITRELVRNTETWAQLSDSLNQNLHFSRVPWWLNISQGLRGTEPDNQAGESHGRRVSGCLATAFIAGPASVVAVLADLPCAQHARQGLPKPRPPVSCPPGGAAQ